jgi:6-phosphogluconolactonase (cycloisomerase 2 family)
VLRLSRALPCLRLLPAGVLAVLGCLAIAVGALGQQGESPEELAARIDRLIVQLDDDNFTVRENASAELAEIGLPAFDKLTATSKDAAVERRQRAAKILAAIKRAEVGLRLASQIRHASLRGAVTLALSPDGRFIYVPGFNANAVNVFKRDAATGGLEHVQSLFDREQLDGVVRLRLSPDGKFAVAPSFRAKSVALFSRDAETGKLTLESTRPHEEEGELKFAKPVEAIFSTDGKFVYAADDPLGIVVVFKVSEGKRLDFVESFAGERGCFAGARGITAHPDGKTLYVGSRQPGTLSVLDRNVDTGKLAIRQLIRDEEGDVHALAGATSAQVSPDGKFVFSLSGRFEGDNAIGVYQVGADGKLALLQEFNADKGDIKDFRGPSDLIISPDGGYVFVSGNTSCSLACFTRDKTTGKLTYVTTLQSVGTGKDADLGANGLKITADGKFLYLAIENASAISVFERTNSSK